MVGVRGAWIKDYLMEVYMENVDGLYKQLMACRNFEWWCGYDKEQWKDFIGPLMEVFTGKVGQAESLTWKMV